jgi:hypothetical protein
MWSDFGASARVNARQVMIFDNSTVRVDSCERWNAVKMVLSARMVSRQSKLQENWRESARQKLANALQLMTRSQTAKLTARHEEVT